MTKKVLETALGEGPSCECMQTVRQEWVARAPPTSPIRHKARKPSPDWDDQLPEFACLSLSSRSAEGAYGLTASSVPRTEIT